MNNQDNGDVLTSAADPLILEIYLYNNNYKDRLLISELKNRAQMVKTANMEDNSFFVKIDDMCDVLYTKFIKDLKNFDSTPTNTLNQSVTSIFFIDSMIRTFQSTKYFKINISDSPVYSRKVKDNIVFDFRVIHSIVDLSYVCSSEFLIQCQRIFKTLGLYQTDSFDKTPYFEITVPELFFKLNEYERTIEDATSIEHEYIFNIKSIFGQKLEKDNCIALVVMEK